MKSRTMLIAAPLALFASQAIAENWVKVPDDIWTIVDKDSIRRGSDGLVYYSEQADYGKSALAVECNKRLRYQLNGGGVDVPDWRDHGEVVFAEDFEGAELKFVCANVP
jgi:hypothetical protein